MVDSIFFRRKSLRSFLDKPIPDDKLQQLFEIIRWSPSCANKQPWRFVFVTDGKQKDKLAASLAKGNEWAAKAPALVVVCAREEDDYSRDDDPVKYYQFDCGLATMSLLLGATELGMMSHPMAGYSASGVKEALSIPDEYHAICVIALGYEGPIDQLDERTRAKDESERTRKPIAETIFRDSFVTD